MAIFPDTTSTDITITRLSMSEIWIALERGMFIFGNSSETNRNRSEDSRTCEMLFQTLLRFVYVHKIRPDQMR